MPSPNSLPTLSYAVLSMLAHHPKSGYDLLQEFKVPVSFFWNAHHSQLYRELQRLEELKLVSYEIVTQEGRPDKKVYRLTNRGTEILRTWLQQPTVPPKPRDELTLKAYALWLMEPEDALELFKEQVELHRDKLERYEGFKQRIEGRWGDDLPLITSPNFAPYAVLQRGLGYEREYFAWCKWMIGQLERALQNQADSTGNQSG